MRPGLPLLLAVCGLWAQDVPRPNRVAWFELFPEPLPDGRTGVTLEGTSQFLRPDRALSADGRTYAQLDAEEWQLTLDGAMALGPGRLALRARVVNRSGGFADQAFSSWHGLLGTPQGGRELVPKYQEVYRITRDGQVVASLTRPATQLLDVDLGWVLPWGDARSGGRWGLSFQLPNGHLSDWSGNGSLDGLLGAAAWTSFGSFRVHGQAEQVWLGLPKDSPLRDILPLRHQARAWGGVGYQGEGRSLLGGLGLDLTLAWEESPYRTGIGRIDRSGWQQHWTFTHHAFPGWWVAFSEEAGTYTAPDFTVALGKKF
jgi:hypothetical protein